jgi:hypothetical protein
VVLGLPNMSLEAKENFSVARDKNRRTSHFNKRNTMDVMPVRSGGRAVILGLRS